MFWTRYRLLAGIGALLVAGAVALGDPLAPGTRAAVVAFVGVELWLLATYAALNGARPVPATWAAGYCHLGVYAGFLVAGLVGASPQPPVSAGLAWLPVALVVSPVPAAFVLGASSRARDRGPYVVGAAAVAVVGPLVANTLRRQAGAADPEVGTLLAAAIALGGAVVVYLAARRRKPGFRDSYPGVDDLPVSRATLAVAAWLLFVVSGWGPARVASGTAFERAWGIVPPEGLLAVPFVALMAVLAALSVGLVARGDVPERVFGLAVFGYLGGAVVATLVPLLDVRVAPPRYLGFASVLLVTGLALAVVYRRATGTSPAGERPTDDPTGR